MNWILHFVLRFGNAKRKEKEQREFATLGDADEEAAADLQCSEIPREADSAGERALRWAWRQ